MLHDLLFRIRALFRRKSAELDLEDELRFHREHQIEKYRKSGLTDGEAARRVRLDFGGTDQVMEECRDARGIRFMETLIQDVRYGLRTLRKSPGFTLIAVLTLALGMGANTAIFSVVYGILLRPLPYRDSSRLIVLNETTPKVGMVAVSHPDFQDWRAQNRVFSGMAIVEDVDFSLSGVDQPENIVGEAVSSNFLQLLGVHPSLGRDFDASEEKPGAAPVALISYALWQSHFGADRRVCGRTVALNGRAFTIVGVLPATFRWLEKVDLLEPIGVWATNNSSYRERSSRGDSLVIARLAPGASLARARAEMEGIAARIASAYPASNDQFGVALQQIRDVFVSDIRPAVLVLFGAVTFVLLIACANVANLFLMRGAGRTREMALRMAIGASRRRLISQMLAESLILTSSGGAIGFLLAVAAIRGIEQVVPEYVLAGANLDLSGAAILLTACVVALAAFIFGLAPAIQATRANLQSELKEGARTSSAGKGSSRWRGVLVSLEVSMALVLLIGAALMTVSLYRLFSVDGGFRPEHLLTMHLSLRTAQYEKDPAILNFWDQVLGRVRAIPGVRDAALGSGVPMTGAHSRVDITIEGMALPKPGSFPHPDVHVVSPSYAGALGIRLMRGRVFTEMDREHAPRVAMVNAALAQQFFPGRDAVGQRFMFGHPAQDPPRWFTIVGVVADTRLYGLGNPSRLEVYVPLHQGARDSMALIVKSAGDPGSLTSEIRRVIGSIDKDQPIFEIATMQQLIRQSVSTQRITLFVLISFSALALILAAIGIYGVISYWVTQRTQEIGIRLALGAPPGNVVRMVIGEGAKLAGAGVLIGIVAAFGLTRLMTKLLYAVSSADPAIFVGMTILLAGIALLASYVPARRTLRGDPVRALRCE